MILNNQQLSGFRQKLSYAVKYRETYDEVYDHVISAIENKDDNAADATSVTDQVIKQDFGGYQNLKQMEKDRTRLVKKMMRKNHWQNIMSFFNWPTIGFTLAVTVAGYFIVIAPVNCKHLMSLVSALAVLPILFLAYKMLLAKYKAWDFDVRQKRSIKDTYIFAAAILSSGLINLLNSALHNSTVLNGGLSLFIFMFYIIYVLSFFKLYREEYKMNIAG
jgi:hypothetical protein